MLKIKNLSKLYNNTPVLNDVSLDIKKGEVAVLLGKSGVGKSTLLRILAHLETADTGTMSLNSKQLDPKFLHKQHLVGMVFQNFSLFEHLTVEQNITLALEKVVNKSKSEAKSIAHQLLKRYGLEHHTRKFVSQLSGGQKQRLAIARSLALKPSIICMDEPTSALDPFLTTQVAQNIEQLAQEDYIILVATHDTTLLEKIPCTIYLMDKGKIVESTNSKDFYNNRKNFPLIDTFVAGNIE